jgi:hypothetical protein
MRGLLSTHHARPNTKFRIVPGAPGSGAPKGARNGNYRHGRFPNEAIEGRRTLNALIRMML